ncbi:MAG: hypothetical protein IE920_03125 [Thiotrichales bacterium]|nr:hypothetical protein [Thiotrichales bacterium]
MKLTIKAEFQSYWHIGTGRGSGQNADALVEKDVFGLPYVPGKTLKGLFRDACFKLDEWEQQDGLTNLLFGIRTGADNQKREETEFGLLRFGNLEMPEKVYLQQRHAGVRNEVSHLFHVLSSTAIDEQTGSAKDKSLRLTEVVIPMTLMGEISLIPPVGQSIQQQAQRALMQNPQQLVLTLQQAASLITHIGANKNRGFGRVRLEIVQ